MFQSFLIELGRRCELKALAERYAGALVDVALENKQADQVKQELAAFAALIRESPELARVSLQSLDRATGQTRRDRSDRRADGREPHAAQLSVCDCRPPARRACCWKSSRRSAGCSTRDMGIMQALVTSAAELTAEERAELAAALAKLTGKKYRRNTRRMRR